jgi:uncharacterized protein YlxW (UPF0749 family)
MDRKELVEKVISKKYRFWISLFFVSLLLGFMLTVQYSVAHQPKTTISSDYLELRSELQVELDKQKTLADQLSKTTQQLNEYKQSSGNTAQMKNVLEKDLQKAERDAGLTTVSGPGLKIVISDDPSASVNQQGTVPVFDAQSLQMIINYLYSNGAQAIAINHQRLVTTSSIRQVGGISDSIGSIQVNTIPIAQPYEIDAIGNITQMEAVLSVNKVVEDLTVMGKQTSIYQITKNDGIVLPPYNGLLPGRYAKQEENAK